MKDYKLLKIVLTNASDWLNSEKTTWPSWQPKRTSSYLVTGKAPDLTNSLQYMTW